MDTFFEIVTGISQSTWDIFLDSAPFLLFGFFIAAIIKVFMPDSLIQKHLGKNRSASVIKAALFGIPIPLCSCGVIPAAIGLRRQGASKGATSSFLISTPETGVDSIAISYALLDPLMTIFRPVAAFFTAVTAGLLENRFGDNIEPVEIETEKAEADSCCCNGSCASDKKQEANPDLKTRFKNSMNYAFTDMVVDIGKFLIIGIIIAGIIAYLVPDNFFDQFLGGGIIAMLAMLVVGIPIYICATSSTPVAAILILKGISPGAALVFLLAGPATNAATIAVVTKTMGSRSLAIYLSTIAVISIVMGLTLDWIYHAFGISILPSISAAGHILPAWLSHSAAALLIILLARGWYLEKCGTVDHHTISEHVKVEYDPT